MLEKSLEFRVQLHNPTSHFYINHHVHPHSPFLTTTYHHIVHHWPSYGSIINLSKPGISLSCRRRGNQNAKAETELIMHEASLHHQHQSTIVTKLTINKASQYSANHVLPISCDFLILTPTNTDHRQPLDAIRPRAPCAWRRPRTARCWSPRPSTSSDPPRWSPSPNGSKEITGGVEVIVKWWWSDVWVMVSAYL